MADPAHDGNPTAAQAGACQVPMSNGEPCGRSSPGPVLDGISYCLMHTPADKDDAAFQREFERILDEAGTGVADFTRFVVPSANYAGREFKADCVFFYATFAQEADFTGATFTRYVTFIGAVFVQDARFGGFVTFMQDAVFRDATFMQTASFGLATFMQKAVFTGATFTGMASFDAKFAHGASFDVATFTEIAYFAGAVFTRNIDFNQAAFAQSAYFESATFEQNAGFIGATFTEGAYFIGATFTQEANVTRTKFTKFAHFGAAKFLGAAAFRETKFREDGQARTGPVFSLAEFSRPKAIVFYKTYLGQALFHNCDLSKLTFSSVEWRRRKNGGKRMVFEEVAALDKVPAPNELVALTDDTTWALQPKEGNPDERDYVLIAELYQQLKKNYDERKDYWTAGDFHYGEMEMKRLHSQRTNRLARWLHQSMGLVAWYKYASQFGESYMRPAAMLLVVLAIFTLLFPWAGLDRNEDAPHSAALASQQTPPPAAISELSYRHFNDFVRAHPGRKWVGSAAFVGNSLMTALSVAGFQKELKYEPRYPLGRALALLELLLTSTLVALFL